MNKELLILAGARTPMTEYSGTPGYGKLKDMSAIDLGAHAIKFALERAGVAPADVDHVVIGNALQTSKDAIYGGRHCALKAGIPNEVPALTVNRICGSGIQSVVSAAQMMLLDEGNVTVAGGMENMSQAPHVVRGGRTGFRFGMPIEFEDLLFEGLKDPYCDLFMAQTAEKLAVKYSISREAQDEFAHRSHMLGAEAVKQGLFAEEIAPIVQKKRGKEIVIDSDDHIKPETTFEGLSKLRAAFGKEGTVTAGNASGIVDGAAAVVLATADYAKSANLSALGVIRGWGIAGLEPDLMGFGPVPAIKQVLDKTGMSLDQIDLFEINEAFAAQYLACEKGLELDRDKVNVNGGAIALGHPLGATGTRLVLTLLMELRRRKQRFGIASACIGGGQGIALLVEAC